MMKCHCGNSVDFYFKWGFEDGFRKGRDSSYALVSAVDKEYLRLLLDQRDLKDEVSELKQALGKSIKETEDAKRNGSRNKSNNRGSGLETSE